MRENEPTERYEFRTSKLLHSYYAVNSIEERCKEPSKDFSIIYCNKLIVKTKQFYDVIFNTVWKALFPQQKVIMVPKAITIQTYSYRYIR